MKKRTRSRTYDSNMLVEIDGVLHVITKRNIKQEPVCNVIELKNMIATHRKRGCVQILKDHGLWNYIFGTVRFLLHFGIVMGLLFCGAWVFMQLEEPEEEAHANTHAHAHNGSTYPNNSLLWNKIENKYSVNVSENIRPSLVTDVKAIIQMRQDRRDYLDRREELENRKLIWMKWFYFTTITTTTIGFGDIFPQTQYGRLFYICFSIIGISTMMTLLKSTGAILSAANKKVYSLFNRYTCGEGGGCMGEEVLSLITMTMFFILFMAGTIWYDTTKVRPDYDRPYIHIVYFWMYTLTTVGFGTTIELASELKHVYQLLLLRVFGLAFLAGVVDSVAVYVEYRKQLFHERARVFRFGSAAIDATEEGEDEDDDEYPDNYPDSYSNNNSRNEEK